MSGEATWSSWLIVAAACWVFLGLVAGRFANGRRQVGGAMRRRPTKPTADQTPP